MQLEYSVIRLNRIWNSGMLLGLDTATNVSMLVCMSMIVYMYIHTAILTLMSEGRLLNGSM